MKHTLLFFAFLLVSCTGQVSPEDLKNLNGYWEIQTATMPDGSKRDYKINETVDYIEINEKTGIRKKVMPQFEGKYIDIGNPKEDFTIVVKDGKTTLQYRTTFSQWEEELLDVSAENLETRNAAGITFKYKRYKPLDLK